jgi:hypothetical protein
MRRPLETLVRHRSESNTFHTSAYIFTMLRNTQSHNTQKSPEVLLALGVCLTCREANVGALAVCRAHQCSLQH